MVQWFNLCSWYKQLCVHVKISGWVINQNLGVAAHETETGASGLMKPGLTCVFLGLRVRSKGNQTLDAD